MDRRAFIGTLTGGLLAAPLNAGAQQAVKAFQVGFLGTATPSLMSAWLTAFREGLRERGYVEGKNISMEYRWGKGIESPSDDMPRKNLCSRWMSHGLWAKLS